MLPLLLEPETLHQQLQSADHNILLIDIGKPERYAEAHLPGAVLVTPGETQAGPPVPGLIPCDEDLKRLLGRCGYDASQHIVVYDDEGGGWAGRFIWILDEIGHSRYSYLNGGIHAWQAAGFSLAQTPPAISPTQPEVQASGQYSLTKDALQAHLERGDVMVWDARSPGEYTGEKVNAARGGHIPGARHYEWTEAMDTTRALKLKDLEHVRQTLQERGITGQGLVATHCQSHHRSGLTYLLGKLLNFERIVAYPGSWAEWGNDTNTPIVTGSEPG